MMCKLNDWGYPVATIAAYHRGAMPSAVAEHRFFSVLAILMTLSIAVGFAPSYYLVIGGIVPAREPLTTLLHIHGAVFTAWMLLYLVQSILPGIGNLRLHRQLGQVGAPLLVALVIVGTATAFHQAALALASHDMDGVGFFAWSFGDIVVFVPFVWLALAQRRNPAVHKRLMALAMCGMMGPGFGRVMDLFGHSPLGLSHNLPPLLFGLAIVGWDMASRRRLLPVTAWGFGLLAASELVRELIMALPGWPALAGRIVSVAG